MIHVITTFYNPAETRARRCADSMLRQKGIRSGYVHWHVKDDGSDDGSEGIFAEAQNKVCGLYRRRQRRGGLHLDYQLDLIRSVPMHPDDIIVVLDGDDWLLKDDALHRVGEWMDDAGALAGYGGSVKFQFGKLGTRPTIKAFSERKLREADVRNGQPVHLRAFRRHVFDAVPNTRFLSHKGGVFTSAADLAMMYPVFELARERTVYFPDTIHAYDMTNPRTIRHNRKLSVERNANLGAIRAFPVLAPLEETG